MADSKMKNLEVLREFRVKGEAQRVGSVIPKSVFGENHGDWQNLCHMRPPRAKETDASVKTASAKPEKKLPGA